MINVHAQKATLNKDEELILANFKKQETCWNDQDIEFYRQACSTSDKIQTISPQVG